MTASKFFSFDPFVACDEPMLAVIEDDEFQPEFDSSEGDEVYLGISNYA